MTAHIDSRISTASLEHHIADAPSIVEQYSEDSLTSRCLHTYRLIK
ncbi:hypothetical protein [Burkholderia contaminans]